MWAYGATTRSAWIGTVSLLPDGATPHVTNVRAKGGEELGMRFTTTAPAEAVGVQFYKSRKNTGIHRATLWSSTGQALARVRFTHETSRGLQWAHLNTPVRLQPGVAYTVSYTSPTGRYSVDRHYFTHKISRGPLLASRSAGVYSPEPGHFPTRTTRASNYNVDVVVRRLPTAAAPPTQTAAPHEHHEMPTDDPTPAEPAVTPSEPSTPQPPATPLCEGMDRWSSASSWDGAGVPTAGASVRLPVGASIQVDVDVPHLRRLEVPSGSSLCFPDRATVFSAQEILVFGRMWAGTESTPLTSDVTIKLEGGSPDSAGYTLTGEAADAIHAYAEEMGMDMGPGVGTNLLLAANGGVIDLHGIPTGRTWTSLAATAAAGGSTLALEDPVTWRPGDVVAVASSDQDWKEQEKATVGSVSTDGRTVTLAAPLVSRHAAVSTCLSRDGETRCVDERAEVGLLSHNLKITGPDSPVDGFGGQGMVGAGGTIRISDTELTRMGQKGRLGAYPLHFHVVGDGGSRSSVTDVSLHDDFNRQITIHGTNNVTVEGTTSYLTYGHSFMFEDGMEVGNTITDNLVMGSQVNLNASERVRDSDRTPSEFWVTNPYNNLVGNHAAGGDGNGFWYDFGEDNHNATMASTEAFGLLDDNVAHSHVDVGDVGRPDHETANGFFVGSYVGSPPARSTANNNVAWKNARTGFWIDGVVDFTGSTAANNEMASTLQGSAMSGGIFLGETANSAGDPASSELFAYGSSLVRSYHGASDYEDLWLGGYGGTDLTQAMSAIGDAGAGITDHPTRIRDIEFFGSGYKVLFDACPFDTDTGTVWAVCYYGPEHSGNDHALYDLDGSIRGDGTPVTITNSSPFMRYGTDFLYPDGGPNPFGTTARGLITPAAYKYVEFTPRDPDHGVTLTRVSDGARADLTTWTMVKLGEKYVVNTDLTMFNIAGNYAGSFELQIPRPAKPTKVGRGSSFDPSSHTALNEASSLANLGVDGVWWWSEGTLYLRVDIDGTDVPFMRAGDETTLDYHEGAVWSIQ